MQISKEELRQCVIENDTKRLKQILDAFGIETEETKLFTDGKRQLLCTLLTYASVCAKKGTLKEEFANELIKRVGFLVELFDFVEAMLFYLDYQPTNNPEIHPPRRLIKEMHKSFPNEEIIYSQARTMSQEQFMFLAELMASGGFSSYLHKKCVAPLLLFVYNHQVIPGDIFFAYVASNLTREDTIGGITITDLGEIIILTIRHREDWCIPCGIQDFFDVSGYTTSTC